MADALTRVVALGVTTNLSRLRAVLAHPAFLEGDLHTGFLEQHWAKPISPTGPPMEAFAAAATVLHSLSAPGPGVPPTATADPWTHVGGWRLGATPERA
jgi:acetyl/propionyl-CoA carboxylase alpha subunit